MNQPYNEKTDSWALGVIFYKMLTGREPFYPFNSNFDDFQSRLQQGDVFIPKDVSLSIQGLMFLQKLLKNDPKKRLNWMDIIQDEYFDFEEKSFTQLSKLYTEDIPFSLNSWNINRDLIKFNIEDVSFFKEISKSILPHIKKVQKGKEKEKLGPVVLQLSESLYFFSPSQSQIKK